MTEEEETLSLEELRGELTKHKHHRWARAITQAIQDRDFLKDKLSRAQRNADHYREVLSEAIRNIREDANKASDDMRGET